MIEVSEEFGIQQFGASCCCETHVDTGIGCTVKRLPLPLERYKFCALCGSPLKLCPEYYHSFEKIWESSFISVQPFDYVLVIRNTVLRIKLSSNGVRIYFYY